MSRQSISVRERPELATTAEIRRILGELDEAKLLDIQRLRPTIVDLAHASMWLSGDPDEDGSGEVVGGVVGEIVTILTADEEDDPVRLLH